MSAPSQTRTPTQWELYGQHKHRPIARLIREYGASHNIAVYDWYNAAGGQGASDLWLKAGLLSRDRVHCTLSGYELAGHMLYEAITNMIKPETKSTDATE